MSVTKSGHPVRDRSTQTVQPKNVGHKSRPRSTVSGAVTNHQHQCGASQTKYQANIDQVTVTRNQSAQCSQVPSASQYGKPQQVNATTGAGQQCKAVTTSDPHKSGRPSHGNRWQSTSQRKYQPSVDQVRVTGVNA
ncbi:hypothetical protein FIBSPDRAFT_905501 [Athelia psychrophila]|uniref:Uncharacterized protein n=1 Tax=Athelia psychrophila TaxID=1759441 RepID=A0A167TDP5_9AGAM|nr:hypothetical protein FIBSPDRAFT_905501 [Fibularhizoctonia sp. CBS 109695]